MEELKTLRDVKEYISTLKIIYTSDYPQERTVREAISQLSKEGIIFIPSSMGKGIYVSIDGASEDEIVSYYLSQEKHFKTQYFNKVLPIKNWIKTHNNAKLMGRLEL